MADKYNEDQYLEQFLGTEKADQFKEMLAEGDRIFHENPAPSPSLKALDNSSAKMYQALEYRKKIRIWRRRVFAAASIAAAIAIVSLVAIYGLPAPQKSLPLATDTGTDYHWPEESVVSFEPYAYAETELEYIEQQLENGYDQFTTAGQSELLNLEAKLSEAENDFWKG